MDRTVDLDKERVDSQSQQSPARASSVRRSIGDWESGRVEMKENNPHSPKKPEAPAKRVLPTKEPKASRKPTIATIDSTSPPKYATKSAEAKACVMKAKVNLGYSRNIKTEIKDAVMLAVDRLYQIVKELENKKEKKQNDEGRKEEPEKEKEKTNETMLIKRMEEHEKLIKESNIKISELKSTLEQYHENQINTYASAVIQGKRRPAEQRALHSVVVTAKNETETGEEVLSRIRKAVNAKSGEIVVEKIRKAKDRKIIVGCRTVEERERLKEKLESAKEHLNVTEIKNKEPLVILRDVFSYNTDEEVLAALRNQNKDLFKDLDDKGKVEILFKRRARNPHTNHIVMRVSPPIWKRMVEAEKVQIDLQRVRVEDQSPLIQCSVCLGYGHPKRFCKENIEKCSHCGGPHKKADCSDWLAGTEPSCCNCKGAKMDKVDHNAFSQECPVRKRWEEMARSAISYC